MSLLTELDYWVYPLAIDCIDSKLRIYFISPVGHNMSYYSFLNG